MTSNHDAPSFHLRGTHLYLVLDDIVQTGPVADIVAYINSLVNTNQLVESVFVKGAMSRDAGRIPEAVALAVFQALSRLTRMIRLEVSGDGRFGGLFLPVKAMTASLQHNCRNHLLNLRLGNVILTTTRYYEDMKELATALQHNLPCLSSIDLVRCRSESADQDATASLEPLVQAIASMPTIQQAMLCETIISSRTGHYLEVLCKSPSIQKLWWKTMPGMKDSHITCMVQQLKTNTVLTELTIRSHGLGEQAGKAIADLLLHNTTLQVINLDLDQAEYGLVIAESLQHAKHTSLICLDVWAWGGTISPEHSRAITKVFTDMLKSNWVLLYLTFQGLDWTNPEIDFYLRLNRAGRQRLLHNFDRKAEWTKVLIKQKDDLDVVYHFLSLNPNILIAETKSCKRFRSGNVKLTD